MLKVTDQNPVNAGDAIDGAANSPQGTDFEAVLLRARQGEASALNELVTRFYDRVQADVHRRLSQDMRRGRGWLLARFSTGDVVQEVFDSVIRDLDAFRGDTEDAFQGFLAVVIRNRIIDSVRHHEAARRDGRRSVDEEDGPAASAKTQYDPAVAASRAEEADRLHESLAELDSREQHLVRARMEGVASFAELAAQLGYGSESAARRAYYNTVARLAMRLRETGTDTDEDSEAGS